MSIIIKNLNYVYNGKTAFRKEALSDITFDIEDGDFLAIIGHTGSGKSTLIQHFNALIKLQSGELIVDGINLGEKKIDYKRLRGIVGMVFQYPEYQLFSETVYKDVAFGPKNLGLPAEEIDRRVREAIELVGLDFDYVAERSPFELSGGEKRRAAIAGVIAMRPKILVLDEPTSGLDPRGKKEILDLIMHLKAECSPTIVMISHDMDEVSQFATKIAVLNEGRLEMLKSPREIFADAERLVALGLDVPKVARLRQLLTDSGVKIKADIITEDELVEEVLRQYKGKTLC
jgi:energy-coupling factor transport system ATP-binding protein